MNDVKKCPYCGKELHSNAQYCMYCMTRLQNKKDITPKEIGYKKWIIACFLLMGVAVIVCTVFLLSQGEDPGRTKHHVTIHIEASTTDPAITASTEELLATITESNEVTNTTDEIQNGISQLPISTEKTDTQTPQNSGNGNESSKPKPTTATQPTSQPTTPVTTQSTESTQPVTTTQPTDPAQPTTQPSCTHTYTAATCISPRTCTSCGETLGSADTKAHAWEAVTGTVHYEEVGHYETVEESYKKTVYLCFFCGYNQNGYASLDALRAHITVHAGSSDYAYVTSRPDLLADTREVWETISTKKWVVDTPAHDETEVTGYVCKLCNSKKNP